MRRPLFFSMVRGEAMYRRFFIEARRANRDVLTRIKYLHVDEMFNETHFVCHTDKDRIVGDLAIQNAPSEIGVVWLKHVSVDPSCRNRGIAKRMIEDCVSHVRRENKILEVSRYSEDGTQFLKPIFDGLGEELPGLIRLPPPCDEIFKGSWPTAIRTLG